MSINIPSTCGLQSSKENPTKVLANGQSSGDVKSDNKRKNNSNSKAVKKVKPQNFQKDKDKSSLSLSATKSTQPQNAAGGDSNASFAALPNESRKQSIDRCIQTLYHACQCRDDDANCRIPSCIKMKRVIKHTKKCAKKNANQSSAADGVTPCPICKQLIALSCYHAKNCDEAKCPVIYCVNIKQKVKHQQLQERLRQAQIVKRRIASTFSFTMSHPKNVQSSSTSNIDPDSQLLDEMLDILEFSI